MKSVLTVFVVCVSILANAQTKSIVYPDNTSINNFTKLPSGNYSRTNNPISDPLADLDAIASGHKCATHIADSLYRANVPGTQTMEEFEDWMAIKIQETKNSSIGGKAPGVIYTIPIICHIIHNGEAVGTGRNISAAQVQSQIDVLNEDFRRAVGTPGYNTDPVGADVEIEFCLAQVDEAGNQLAEPGINRINRNTAGFSGTSYDMNYTNNNIKPGTQWDPNQYFNIWVEDMSGSTLGYAQFPSTPVGGITVYPGGPANTDGVVIDYQYFGSSDKGSFPVLAAPYDKGRTATHEVGHCLGLHHIWGDGGCTVDDYCNDTPTSNGSNYGCPNVTNCGSNDMVENYMDYSDDQCMNIFTIDQTYRMITIMENSPRRVNLLSSTVCDATAPPVCDFTATPSTPDENQSVSFVDNTTGIPTSWNWNFPSGSPATSTNQNPTASWPTSGTYSVTLSASNSAGSCTSVETITVTPPPAPTCAYSFSPNPAEVGDLITFTDNSSGSPSSWNWTFSGALPTSSTAQNPAVTYASTGTFGVTLTATNSSGSCTTTGSISVVDQISCDTINNPISGNLSTGGTTTCGGGGFQGYIAGYNCYNDISKAELIQQSQYGTNTHVTGARIAFRSAYDGGNGSTVDIRVWDNDGAGGAPNTILASETYLLSDIDAVINPYGIASFYFNNPVPVTGDYYIGYSMNLANGDSLGTFTNSNDGASMTAWEQWDDNSWQDFGDWGYTSFSQYIQAYMTDLPVDANPTVNQLSICEGESLDFDASSSTNVTSGYQWFFNGATPNSSTAATENGVNYASAGQYTAYLYAFGQCGGVSLDSISNISVTLAPTLSITTTDENCGQNNGTATAIPTGGTPGYTYNWDSGNSNQTELNLSNGPTSVTVTDANSCSVSGSATINDVVGPTATITVTDETCGLGNGTATAVISGGTAPYSYNWTGGGSGQTLSNLNAGVYTVTVTDAGACSVISSVTLTNVAGPTISTSVTDATCGSSNGTATAIVSGGAGGYSFNWSSGGNAQTETGLTAGSYTVIVTDANTCTVSDNAVISSSGGPTGTTSSTDATCNNPNGTASITVTGGTPGYTYTWSSGGTLASETGLLGGNYFVTVSDGAGCDLVTNVLVNDNGIPNALLTTSDETCGNGNGSATVTASAGNGGYTYTWSSSAATNTTESGLSAGPITVTVTDAIGCTVTSSETINNASGPSGSVTTTDATCGNANGTATAIAVSGVAPYSYTWSVAGSNQTLTNLSATTYEVTITDANSCTVSASGTVNASNGPVVSTSTTDANCGLTDGAAIASSTGGTPPINYFWNDLNNQSTSTATGLSTGLYTVTAVDNNNCSVTQSVTVSSIGGSPKYTVSITTPVCNGPDLSWAITDASGGSVASGIIGHGVTNTWQVCDCGQTFTLNAPAGTNGPPGQRCTTDISPGAALVYDENMTLIGSVTTDGSTIDLSGFSNCTLPCPTVATSVTTSSCGGSDGSATAIITGGNTPFSYNWSSGGNTITENGLSAGNYEITVGDAAGCSVTASAIINNDSPTNIVTTVSETCGYGNGSATLATSGGTAPYSYSWPSGGTLATETGLTANTYQVTISDAGSCIAFENVTITNIDGPTGSATSTNSTCGDSNGSATIVPIGGTSGYSYTWSSGQSGASETNLFAGNYTVTITDANSCTITQSVTVSDTPGPSATVATSDASCGGNNGTATAIVSGGSTPLSFLWNNGQTSTTIVGLNSANYTVTITDANSCTSVASGGVNNIGGPSVATSTTNETCSNSNGSATSTITGGTTPYTIIWSSGGTGTIENNLSSGNYTVTVSDGAGCNTIASANVIDESAPTVSTSITSATCGSSNGSISLTTSGGLTPFSYSWSSGGTGSVETGLSSGNYSVTITDNNSCSVTSSSFVTNTTPGLTSSVTDATCGNSNGSATILTSGGLTPYTFAWSNGGNNATEPNLSAGNYTVTVTDGSSCVSSVTVLVGGSTLLTGISITTTNSNCGNNDGTATAVVTGGTAPYGYNWSSGANSATATNLSPTNQSVTVTDAIGCTITGSSTINNTAGPNLSILPTSANCNQPDGIAAAFANGGTTPYIYAWSNGGFFATENTLLPGPYTLTVTDGNGCIVTESTVIGNIAGPSLSSSFVSSTCGASNGSASVSATNGTAPYNYNWSNGGATSSINNVYAGNYNVTVEDDNGCTISATVPVSDLSGPSIAVSAVDATCGSSNGSASINITWGTSPYSYNWNTGSTTNTENNLAAGNYLVTVTDDNGCVAITSYAINTSGINVTTNFSNETCSSSNGSAAVTVTGGNLPYSYSWSNGATTSSIINLSSNLYDVTITDGSGCQVYESFNLTNSSIPFVIVTATDATCGSADAIATSTVISGTTPYSYSWSTGGINNSEINLSAGGYSLLVTDANSCTATASFIVNNAFPNISVSSTSASCGSSNGSALVSAVGGTIPYTYNWSSGGSSNIESNIPSGNYTVTVTDASNCTSVQSITVDDTPSPTVNVATTDATCGSANGTAIASASGGSTPYSFLWSTGATTASTAGLSAGFYSVIVTDNIGCATVSNLTINNPGNILATASITDATCNQSNGAVSLSVTGGQLPYVIAWSGGAGSGSSISGLNGGTYTATIFDANSCVTIQSITVGDIAGPVSNLVTTDEFCSANNGEITINVSGGTAPYSYSWSNGATLNSQTGLSSGNYSVTISDVTGCSNIESSTLNNIAGPSALVNTTNNICDQQNGTATVLVSGGTPNYTYLWSNGSTISTSTGLSGGTQNATITDDNGCSIVASGIVSDLSGPVIAASGNNETCTSGNGTGNVVVNGGATPYVYIWSSGGIGATENNLSSGTYFVTVIDNNGCNASQSIRIINEQPVITVTGNDANCGMDNGTIQTALAGGVGPYNYGWSNGANSSSLANLSSGSYTLSVIDGNGCLLSETVLINDIAMPVITLSITDAKCNDPNGSIVATVAGGEPPYSYSWSGGNSSTSTQSGLGSGSYSVFVTDNDGCLTSELAIVNNYASPNVSLTSASATCDANNGSVSAEANGGAGTLTYEWSNGENTESISGLAMDTYYVSVTDANNCTTVDTATVDRIEGICLDVPSGFSPNNDGINDFWNIYGAEFYPELRVEIYNRWGSVLFESDGYSLPWNGTNANGNDVPSAVYYYIVTLGEEVRTGTVTIKR